MVPTRPGRPLMYALVSLQGLPNWVIRGGLASCAIARPQAGQPSPPGSSPSLTQSGAVRRAGVPIVVADLGLSDADRAMLLAAWFPGYLCSQIPGAALIQGIGPKIVMGLNTAGVCGFFMLLPWLARLGRSTAGSVRIMAACLTVCGFCQVFPLPTLDSSPAPGVSARCPPLTVLLRKQGPLIPGQQVMRRNWLPKPGSPERPIHLKFISLGGQFSGLLASVVTPIIATRLGWRAVNRIMGGGGLCLAALWFAKAASAPLHFKPRPGSAQPPPPTAASDRAPAPAPAPKPPTSKGGKVSLAFLRDPAVLATLWCKMASGNMNYTMTSYTPTIFMEVLGCDPVQVASYLVWQT